MEISKKGFGYKLATTLWGFDQGRNVTLCRFFRQMVGTLIATVVLYFVAYIVFLPFMLLFGYRWRTNEEMDRQRLYGDLSIPIQRLTTKSGILVRPVYFLAVSAVIALFWWLFTRVNIPWKEIGIVLATTLVCLVASALLGYVGFKLAQSEVGRITWGYVKAAKRGICPIITFTE